MKKLLRQYLGVYQKFVETSAAVNMSFRTSFVLLIFMDVFFYASTLGSVDIIYDHVTKIGPWHREDLMFFMAFMLTIDNLHMMLVSESFWVLGQDIKTGQLDYTILKPLSSVFSCFFRWFRPSSLVSFPVVVFFLIKYGRAINLEFYDWLMLPVLIILGFALLIFIEFIFSASMFWLTEGHGANFLRMEFQRMARWPDFVYSSITRRVFTTVFPILLIGSAPVHFLVDKTRWPMMIILLATLLVSILILGKVWNFGLRHYDSASS